MFSVYSFLEVTVTTWRKDLKRQISKEIKMKNKYEEMLSGLSHQENTNWNITVRISIPQKTARDARKDAQDGGMHRMGGTKAPFIKM